MTRAKKFIALCALTAGVVAGAVAPATAAEQTTGPQKHQQGSAVTLDNRHGSSEPATGSQPGNRQGA